jgi:hypothetical protein
MSMLAGSTTCDSQRALAVNLGPIPCQAWSVGAPAKPRRISHTACSPLKSVSPYFAQRQSSPSTPRSERNVTSRSYMVSIQRTASAGSLQALVMTAAASPT